MPRIIFVSTLTVWSLEKGQGGPAFSQTLQKYMNEGWDVFLISDEVTNDDYDCLPEHHNIVLEPTFFKKLARMRKLGLLFRWLDHLCMTEQFCKEIRRIIGENTSDTVLYAYEVFGVKACRKVSKELGIPFVTRFQGTILSQYENKWINHVRWYPHYQALSQKADLVIMTNDGTKGLGVLKELENDSKILFLQNGLDLLERDLAKMKSAFSRKDFRVSIGGIKDDECMFLTVSRLVSWKRVERAIDGFAEYCKRRSEGKLVIVGEGDTKSNLMERVNRYGISDRVIFIGPVAHDEVYKYMMACDIFLSLYDLSNVGNPLLEAMTLGKCIVTLDVGDTSTLIINRENGILLKMEQLPLLGEFLIELADITDLRRRLADAAACYAKLNFRSWSERMNIEFLEVCKLLKGVQQVDGEK